MGKIDTSKALDTEVVRNAAIFVGRVLGQPIENGMGILFADALKARRIRNIIKLQAETEKLKIENQKAVPLSFGYNLLDNATLEEDKEMVSRWANLLANAMDADFEGGIRKIYIDILDKLEPIDALVLEAVDGFYGMLEPYWELYSSVGKNNINTSVDVLISLGLLKKDYVMHKIPITNNPSLGSLAKAELQGEETGEFQRTALGNEFINAVIR